MAEMISENIGVVISDELKESNRLKDQGNAFISANKFALAAERYTEAIEIFPTAILYSNRAQALIKLESYGLAIEDANEAISLDPKYIKAYYRRASARFALGKYKEALSDFKAVVRIAPKDKDAMAKMRACEKAYKEGLFAAVLGGGREAAGVSTSSLSISEEEIGAIKVDASYSGPRLPDVTPVSADGGSSGDLNISMTLAKEILEYFRAEKTLHRKYVMKILWAARIMFSKSPTLLRLSLPRSATTGEVTHFNVCGDTHGQYYDLLNIFEIGGFPSEENPYLFNGDFVDRGSFSFETVMALIVIKLAAPNALFMLRGNHETKNMNKIYGFEGEVKFKYDDTVMGLFTAVFNWLPLSAVIENKIFVVHGGLSTQNNGEISLAEIEAIKRNSEPPESGLMSDLLWSDPQQYRGRAPSKRGMGFNFGPDFTDAFLKKNDLKLVVRSHEVKDEGYVVEHDGKCITIFSAPNYCDQMGNKGAFIRFKEDLEPEFNKFDAVPHPPIPPMKYAANIFGY